MQVKYDFKQNIFLWYNFNYDSNLLEINSDDGIISDLLCKKVKNITCCDIDKSKFKLKNENIKIKNNFSEINLDEKYDYVVINQLDKYINDNKISIDRIFTKINKILNNKGIILFTIKNKYSLKNFCGDLQDDNVFFLNNNYKTYSKKELENIFQKYNYNYKFYYPFPNSAFTEILLTDEYLNKKTKINYLPLHYKNKNFFMDEYNFFKMVKKDRMLPFFSNDFFVELSLNKIKTKLSFIKFNNYRKLNCNLYTYCIGKKYYKTNVSQSGLKFLNEYRKSCDELNKIGIKSIQIKEDYTGIYTDEVISDSFLQKIIKKFEKYGEKSLEKNLKIYDEYLKKYLLEKEVKVEGESVFNKYHIKITKEKINQLHFLRKAYIDIIPQNMLIDKKEYYLIDQEWTMENVPYEYILYRGILSVLSHFDDVEIRMKKYFDMFDITKYFSEFQMLEKNFYDSIETKEYQNIKKYHNYNLINAVDILQNGDVHDKVIKEKNNEINLLKVDNRILTNENENLKNLINEMLNSKSWKLTKPLRFILNKLRR